MVKYYCIIFKSKCALWVNETTGKLFKTCFLCAALVKKAPSDHFVILKKVKRKSTILCVLIVYSIAKKNVLCNSSRYVVLG